MIFLNCIIRFVIYFITSSLSLFGVHDIDNVRFHFSRLFFFFVSSLVSFARGKEGIERKIRVSTKEEKGGTKL